MRRLWLILALLAVAASTIAVVATQAGGAGAPTDLYTAKFACGEFGKGLPAAAPDVPEGPVAPGYYQTAINVHNPNLSGFGIAKKAVLLYAGKRPVTESNFEQSHRPGKIIQADISPDGGILIDCQDIRAVLLPGAPPAPVFIEGFVVVLVAAPAVGGVPPPLDVSALYTGHSYNCGGGTSGCAPLTREGFSEQVQLIPATHSG